jgi:hypothetical protein
MQYIEMLREYILQLWSIFFCTPDLENVSQYSI